MGRLFYQFFGDIAQDLETLRKFWIRSRQARLPTCAGRSGQSSVVTVAYGYAMVSAKPRYFFLLRGRRRP